MVQALDWNWGFVSLGDLLRQAQNWEAKAELQSLIEELTNTDSKDQKDDVLEEKSDKINQYR